MRRLLSSIFLALVISCPAALCQDAGIGGFEGLSIDTVTTAKKKFEINNYSSVSVNFGTTFSRMMFNPSYSQTWLHNPFYASVMFTKHLKMFDFIPYFGFQIGFAYGHEGYKFKENKETGYIHNIEGAQEARFNVVEMPVMTYFHVDFSHFKIEASAGPYVGYRWSIERKGDDVPDSLRLNFTDYDRKWEFGIEGGAGFAIMMDPFEFHVNALVRYSMSTIFAPDSSPSQYNQYYYRFAYPFDVNITAGVAYQITRRTGRTKKALRQEAKEIVLKEIADEHSSGKNRK